MHPEFILISVGRHTDMEMTATKVEVQPHRPLGTAGAACHAGPHRGARASQEVQGAGGSLGESLHCQAR